MSCAYCGKPAEGNYSIHRDGFDAGPEVPLCDVCGSSETYPSITEIWSKIANPEPVIEAIKEANEVFSVQNRSEAGHAEACEVGGGEGKVSLPVPRLPSW